MNGGGVFLQGLVGIFLFLPEAARAQNPSRVTVVGNMQTEAGCPGDWMPDCESTRLTYDANDGVWQGSLNLPAGTWQYKVALNDSWEENYPANNRSFTLAAPGTVKFYYDPVTHAVTDSISSLVVTVAGSFQSEVGCASDWDPACLRTMLQDPEGNGTYTRILSGIPAGTYEAKVAINESWDENYGQGGTSGGASVVFQVADANEAVTFRYNSATHVLSVGPAPTGFGKAQSVRVVSEDGGGFQEVNYNYATGQQSVSPYYGTTRSVPRFFPSGEWTGIFHYDYGAGAFTQAVYSRQHSL